MGGEGDICDQSHRAPGTPHSSPVHPSLLLSPCLGLSGRLCQNMGCAGEGVRIGRVGEGDVRVGGRWNGRYKWIDGDLRGRRRGGVRKISSSPSLLRPFL